MVRSGCCASTISSGSRSAACSNVSNRRNWSKDGEQQLTSWNEHGHRARCAEGCRAACSNSKLQTLTRNPGTQESDQLTGLIDSEVWRKLGRLDAFAKVGWNDWAGLSNVGISCQRRGLDGRCTTARFCTSWSKRRRWTSWRMLEKAKAMRLGDGMFGSWTRERNRGQLA